MSDNRKKSKIFLVCTDTKAIPVPLSIRVGLPMANVLLTTSFLRLQVCFSLKVLVLVLLVLLSTVEVCKLVPVGYKFANLYHDWTKRKAKPIHSKLFAFRKKRTVRPNAKRQ